MNVPGHGPAARSTQFSHVDAVQSPQVWAAVTGASSGIGKAFAHELSSQGYAVLLIARHPATLNSVADALPGPSEVLAADLSTPIGIARVEAQLRTLSVELLVNNAATGRWGPFTDLPQPTLEGQESTDGQRTEHGGDALVETVGVNVLAVARLARAVLPGMLAAGHGGILTVSSPAGARPSPMLAVYGASKAFVDALDSSLRAELAARGATEITVTTVWPGWTHTGFHQRLDQDITEVPAQLWTSPEEVAHRALAAHHRGAATVRVPQPTWRQQAIERVRRLRRDLPSPVKAARRRARTTSPAAPRTQAAAPDAETYP